MNKKFIFFLTLAFIFNVCIHTEKQDVLENVVIADKELQKLLPKIADSDDLKQKLKNVLKEVDLTKKVTKKTIKKILEKYSIALSFRKNLLRDDMNDSQYHSYKLIQLILKFLKQSKIYGSSKTEYSKNVDYKIFEDAIDYGCGEIKKQIKLRELFLRIVGQFNTGPGNDEKLLILIQKNPDVLKMFDKENKNGIIHYAISVINRRKNKGETKKKVQLVADIDSHKIKRLKKIVKLMEQKYPAGLKHNNSKSESILHTAADKNLIMEIYDSLNNKTLVDLVGMDDKGNTPLHRACINNSENSAIFLFDKNNSNANLTNKKNQIPLHFSAMSLIITEKLAVSSDVTKKDSDGNTPLHKYVMALKEKWQPTKDGETVAQYHPAYRSMNVLIQKNPLVKTIKNNKGKTALDVLRDDSGLDKKDNLYKNAEKRLSGK